MAGSMKFEKANPRNLNSSGSADFLSALDMVFRYSLVGEAR